METGRTDAPGLCAWLLESWRLSGTQKATVRAIKPALDELEHYVRNTYSNWHDNQPQTTHLEVEAHFSEGAALAKQLASYIEGLISAVSDRPLTNLGRMQSEDGHRFCSAMMVCNHRSEWLANGGGAWIREDSCKVRKLGSTILSPGEMLKQVEQLATALESMKTIAKRSKEAAARQKKNRLFEQPDPLWWVIASVYDAIKRAGRAETHTVDISWEINRWGAEYWAPLASKSRLAPEHGSKRGKAIYTEWKKGREGFDYSITDLPELPI